jgi:SAM-dependent methyltransferase
MGERRGAAAKARGDLSTPPPLVDRWYPERRYGGFTHVDGTVAFYARINSVLDSSSVVLDLGCGRGAAMDDALPWRRDLQVFRGKCARVIGADVDPGAATNPLIDEFHLIDTGRVPLPDGSIDVCVSDFVVEHVDDVDLFFAECARVLRTGGLLFVRTPNVWNYMGIASRLVPSRLHARVLNRIQADRKEKDVFPTLYRCNSVRKLRAALERHGFDAVVQTQEPEPAYVSFSGFLYALAVFHQRHAPRPFRRILLAFAQKH